MASILEQVVIKSLFLKLVLMILNCENILSADADEWGKDRTHFTTWNKLANINSPFSFLTCSTSFQNVAMSPVYFLRGSISAKSCHSKLTVSMSKWFKVINNSWNSDIAKIFPDNAFSGVK